MTTKATLDLATGEMIIRDLTDEEEAALEAERANAPPPPPRRIHGYTIVARIEANYPDTAKALLAAIKTSDPIGYDRMISAPNGVAVNDPRLLAGIKALGLDADILLAP